MKIKSRTPPFYKSEHGQSLVELAISLTAILVLLAGAVDFSMAFFSYVALRDAAQEGALYGSMNPTDTDGIENRVRAASSNPVDLTDTGAVNVAVVVNGDDCEGFSGGVPNSITVSVTYDYPISMPFVGAIVGAQQIPLTATVTDTILQPACPLP